MTLGATKTNWRRAPANVIERKIDIASKRLSLRALEVLENALDPKLTPQLDYKYRIVAAKEILDRAWGKPKQRVEARIETAPSDEFVATMKAAEERERAARERRAQMLQDKVEAIIVADNIQTEMNAEASEGAVVLQALLNK